MVISIAEAEEKAKRAIQKECPPELMDIETIKVCQETRRIFIVLRCKEDFQESFQKPPKF
jgi:hypothetical protein